MSDVSNYTWSIIWDYFFPNKCRVRKRIIIKFSKVIIIRIFFKSLFFFIDLSIDSGFSLDDVANQSCDIMHVCFHWVTTGTTYEYYVSDIISILPQSVTHFVNKIWKGLILSESTFKTWYRIIILMHRTIPWKRIFRSRDDSYYYSTRVDMVLGLYFWLIELKKTSQRNQSFKNTNAYLMRDEERTYHLSFLLKVKESRQYYAHCFVFNKDFWFPFGLHGPEILLRAVTWIDPCRGHFLWRPFRICEKIIDSLTFEKKKTQ